MRAAIERPADSGAGSRLVELENGFELRRRLRDTCVAASVLVAAGLWIFAFAGGIGGGAGTSRPEPRDPLAADGARAPRGSDPSSLLAQLARVAPSSLGSALDASLFGELERIGQDATRTARFLAGRVPASLVPRADASR